MYFKADWSQIDFLSKPLFSLQLKICRFYLAYTCKDAFGSKVWWKYYHCGRGKYKAAEKDPSATTVAIVHSTGATAVGRVNATEFWQRQTQPPSVLLLLSYKMDLAIPHSQWSTLHPGSQMVNNNSHFCNNYFCTQFASLSDVHRNNLKWNSSNKKSILKSRWKKQSKEVTVTKTVITTAYLATWWKQKSLRNCENLISRRGHFTPELQNTFEVFLCDRLVEPGNRTWPMQSESVLLERAPQHESKLCWY